MVGAGAREGLSASAWLYLPLEDMEPWIREWDAWMGARGEFYDYDDTDGAGRRYRVHAILRCG